MLQIKLFDRLFFEVQKFLDFILILDVMQNKHVFCRTLMSYVYSISDLQISWRFSQNYSLSLLILGLSLRKINFDPYLCLLRSKVIFTSLQSHDSKTCTVYSTAKLFWPMSYTLVYHMCFVGKLIHPLPNITFHHQVIKVIEMS